MTEESQTYNLRVLRELLIDAFDTEELRSLVSHDPKLGGLIRRFAPAHPITVMAEEAVSWCDRRGFISYLVQRIEEERPEKYQLFEPDLFVTDAEPPREEEPSAPTPEILTITGPIYLDLVRVPAGEFLMGSVAARDKHADDTELPPHRVHVPEFHIGQYPVTNLQYQAFVEETGYQAPHRWESDERPSGKGNHPVARVSWRDALAFCAWLSEATGQPFRLPTEAEWEKAARGTDGRIYPWGDEPPDASRCNFDNQVGDTTPIGRYSPQGDSPYGLTDMAGNVLEWCQSQFRPYPYRARDGREQMEWDEPRILRGGDYSSDPARVRCGCRYVMPDFWYFNRFGFRVARGPLK